MKTLTLITIITFGVAVTSMAQIPTGYQVVTDPTTHANIVQNTAEAARQTQALKEQIELFKEAKKVYEKVSNSIKQLDLIEDIISDQQYVIQRVDKSYQYLKNSGLFTPGELSTILVNFSKFITTSERTLSTANSAIKDGFFKMNDAERIKLLQDLSTRVNGVVADVNDLDNKYRRVAEKRALKRTFEGN